MELTLECQKRPADSKPNALRRSGLIPAVLYGHNGAESVDLAVQAKTAELLVRDASLNNSLITINVADLPWTGKALLREIQTHPWKGTLYHLSFFSVGSQASLDADVPVHVVGEAPGVKTGGGSLDQVLTSLHVRCAPDRIPEVINVDISNLQVGGAVHVGELPLPEGVVALAEKDQIVLSILAPSGGGGSSSEESAE
jgi:large subunit ribosomal protein L25